MSNAAVIEFLSKVQADLGLQAQVRGTKGAAAVAALAGGLGYSFSAADLEQVASQTRGGELSEAQLESVAGGYNTSQAWYALFGDANGNGGIFDF